MKNNFIYLFLDKKVMYKAKFFRVAASLDSKTWRRFRKYVHSNSGKRSVKVECFLDHVFAAHPDFSAPLIGRAALHKRVFPDLPHSDQRLFDHLSYLYDLLEKFLVDENRQRELIAEELIMVDYFRRNGMQRDFHHSVKKARQKLASFPEGEEKALAQYRLASQQEALFSGLLKEQSRTTADGLQEKMNTLESHFLFVRFKYACEMLNRQNVIGTSYETGSLPFAMHMYEALPEQYASNPLVGAYYRALRMFMNPENLLAYRSLREMLETQSGIFPSEEARTLYVYAQNFCIRRINQGQEEYFDFLFALYQEMLDRGTIYENGRLSQWDYKNIVSLGLRLEKKEWVSGFLESERNAIAPGYRENAYLYNRAYFDYATRNYPGALRLLQKVEFSDVFYHLGTKAIQMKIYYELEETEALLSLLSTFKTYLRRQKGISSYQRRTHLNLVKFVQKLDRVRDRAGRMRRSAYALELKKLQSAVEEADGISNLHWLLAQIRLLMPPLAGSPSPESGDA